MPIDEVKLAFSPESLTLLNIILGFIMYGVALELKLDDFIRIVKQPKSPILGAISQFLLLPALTFLLVLIIRPMPSMALGMMLVAACPGGNVSNFISSLAKGNTALSVSLTALATLLAVVMTPLNFAFWGGLYGPTAEILKEIQIDIPNMIRTVFLLLGLPLILGMFTAHRFPNFTAKITRPVKILSLIFFGGFVIVALYNNFEFFLKYIHLIALIVLAHNAIGFGCGYGWGKLWKLPNKDIRALTIETGIQNSGLALVLIFSPLYNGMGGMALIAAWWGIWHMVAGGALAYFWSRKEAA